MHAAAGPSTDPSKYVGAETCKTCHEEIYNSWEKSPHWKTTLNKEAAPSKQGCEACHGPGAEHVEGGGDKTKIFVFEDHSRQETSARCLTCHGEGREQAHFSESAHSNSNVGCLDCHSPHHAKEKPHLLGQSTPQLCYGCHTSAKADFAKPYHHRVNEGLLECNDCHNPHGTAIASQLRTMPNGDAICYKCHVDKQGPFVYEHVPVKTEGCTSCHTPHGSTNPRFLRVSLVNMLCLQCHTFPTQGPAGPAHNQSAKYQACTMCHVSIHGSNFSNVFFKRGTLMTSPRKLGPSTLLSFVLVLGLLASSPQSLPAQSSTGSQNQPAQQEGVTAGDYVIHTSAEIGYRYTNVTGSDDMYDTLVNLQTGPRFLDETFSMQSQDDQGLLFDNLSVNSFGWGGDPNNVLRARVEKNKWYNFLASFRRDQNFFDYDLLVNPLNPPTSSPSIPVLNSPHAFDTTRRMTDIDLTLLPQSVVSFRFGYSHNNMTGPSYTSIHTGTDALLLQPWNTTMNAYRFGADWKVAPRTVLSYDQFLYYYKGDTDPQLSSFAMAFLPGGGTVELGLPIDTANKSPCAVVPPATSLISSSGTLTNLDCNAYFSYFRNQRIRTSTPMERLSLRSNYFQRVELLGSFTYSSADMNTPQDESFNGLESRSDTRAFTTTGTGSAHQISNVLDLEGTVHVTTHIRIIDKFYYWAFRIPENANFTEIDSICTATCNLLTPLSATAPEATTTLTQASFNQTWITNQTQVAWDISKKVGVNLGFRYSDQVFKHFNDFLPGDEDYFAIHGYSELFGVWARPIHALRLNFNQEYTSFDNVIVRISPRKQSQYRFQAGYTPRPWAVLGGSINIFQQSNGDSSTNYQGHNRNYGLTASLAPNERFALDLAYNYNDVMQNALICFNDTPPPGVSLPFVNNAASCAANDSSNPLLANSYYTNHTNFGMFTVRFQPIKRLTLNLGGSITSVDGTTPQFNILQPLGSLQYRYYQPVANFSVDLTHGFAWNSGWNYYQYNEGSFVGPTAPRYFHANTVTESLRYSF